MSNIIPHIANATGELDSLEALITSALNRARPIVVHELQAQQIDIFFISASLLAMPEYGIGGNSPGPNHIYISFDPVSKKITEQGLFETLLHEIHHCMRWRNPGYGVTLGEAMISEGMACLYEEEHRGTPPLYATAKISSNDIREAKKLITSDTYDHAEWFFGTKDIPRWFGYTYGHQLCKQYAQKHQTNAKEMLHLPASVIIPKQN